MGRDIIINERNNIFIISVVLNCRKF